MSPEERVGTVRRFGDAGYGFILSDGIEYFVVSKHVEKLDLPLRAGDRVRFLHDRSNDDPGRLPRAQRVRLDRGSA